MTNRNKLVSKALAPLEETLLKNIKQPTTIEEARTNLRRFYGCHKGNLRIYMDKFDQSGHPVIVADGTRKNGKWEPSPWTKIMDDPHPAIMFQCALGGSIVTDIDIEQLNRLGDIYQITETGYGSNRHNPSFSMNVWTMPGSNVNPDHSRMTLLWEAHHRIGYDTWSDWLECEDLYKIYDNFQPALSKVKDFTAYLLRKGVTVNMYQTNNLDKRYLHWLLLGPFAPYQFKHQDSQKAA